MPWLAGTGGAVLLAVVVVVVIVVTGGGSKANAAAVQKTAVANGCTFNSVPSTHAALHISSFSTHVTYNSFPPTSGKHYYQPAIWGDYSQAVDPRQAVHNEEHGGIVIWYGPKISQQTRSAITAFYQGSPNAMLVTPLLDKNPGTTVPAHKPLGSHVALTAWVGTSDAGHGYIVVCPGFNEKVFKSFRDAFRGKGPERFPVDTLTPGS
jgi:hypothetical protein